MSNQISNLCRTLKLTPPQKCVLMALADRADDAGLAWPSIAWICEWTCFGKTAVIDALKGLEGALLITNVRTTGRNNQCKLHLDRIAEVVHQQTQRTEESGRDDRRKEGYDQSATRTNLSATRTSPPDGQVRQTDYHQSARRTTTSPRGGPTRPPDGHDTSLNTTHTSINTSISCPHKPPAIEPSSLWGTELPDSSATELNKPQSAYSPDFEAAWQIYPSRPGKSKQSAWKAWVARLKAGITAEEMTRGIEQYAAYVVACGTSPQFIKQPDTFLGPGLHFQSDWTVPQMNKQEALEQRNRNIAADWARGPRKPSSHSGFDKLNYSEGIDENGYIIG